MTWDQSRLASTHDQPLGRLVLIFLTEAKVFVNGLHLHTAVIGDDAHETSTDVTDFIVGVEQLDVIPDRFAGIWVPGSSALEGRHSNSW